MGLMVLIDGVLQCAAQSMVYGVKLLERREDVKPFRILVFCLTLPTMLPQLNA